MATFGEKAVGLDFNPSGNEDVNKVKQLFAEIIDLVEKRRSEAGQSQKGRHLSVGLTDSETAQMRIVKGLTWEDK